MKYGEVNATNSSFAATQGNSKQRNYASLKDETPGEDALYIRAKDA